MWKLLRVTSCVSFLIVVCVLITLSAVAAGADWNYDDINEIQLDEDLSPAVKRYARLSYFRPPSRSRGRYGWGRSSYRYKPRMPWDYLPDKYCYRQPCRSTYDCCKRYSLCDPNGRRCYDCWYGHPCRSSKDCCQRFPHCNTALQTCTD